MGKKVWIKATDKLVQIYHQHMLIKQHVITDGYRHTDFNDFPANVQAALDDGVPLNLQRRAETVGDGFAKLIRSVLQPHAFMNIRKAQGLLRLAQKYDNRLIEKAATLAVQQNLRVTPKLFTRLLEKITYENQHENQPPLSQQSLDFVRQADYFIH